MVIVFLVLHFSKDNCGGYIRYCIFPRMFGCMIGTYCTSTVLGYKGKSGAVPQKVLAYCLFWVSPDFFPPYKKMPRNELV